jgi:HD superfamily phosphodiesterase
MGQYAELIAELPLLQQLKASAGRDQIPETDVAQLYALVLRAADTSGPLLSRIPITFTQYTEHDIGHCRNLLDLCGRFIPQATLQTLNAVELTLLALSVLLHDFGMFVSEEEKRAALQSPEFNDYIAADGDRQSAIERAEGEARPWEAEYLRDAALAEYFRRIHPERAATNIRRYIEFPLAYRDVDLGGYVSILAESHGWAVHEPIDLRRPEKTVRELRVKQPVYGVPVNLQYLACCLRLADIMDFDRSRTPVAVFNAVQFSEERSREEWNKHLQVTGWLITPQEALYAAECTRPAFYVSVMQFLDLIDREIQDCKRLLSQTSADVSARYRLDLSPVVDRSRVEMVDRNYLAGGYRFELDYDRIMALLMDRSLYADPSLFARELVQNAADACRFAASLAADAKATYVPKIVISEKVVDGVRQVSVQDNGVGMSLEVLLNYFLRVGRSFYRSRDFLAARARLAASGIDLDATSQFGIGILSCFMVCDTFRVETYRRAHRPLSVVVEGATKYFVIQQLPEPERRDFEPPADGSDGPPTQPGTRVTLSITKATDVDVVATIAATAVNLEYDVEIRRADRGAVTVRANGWQDLPLPGDQRKAIGRSSEIGGARWQLHEHIWSEIYDPSLLEVLVPSMVRFSSHPSSSLYRGAAWLWLLRDSDGCPVPARGYLRISDTLKLRGAAAVLGELVEHTKSKYVVYPGLRQLGALLGSDVESDELGDNARDHVYTLYSEAADEDQDPDELTNEFCETWKDLCASERTLVATSLQSMTDKPANWRTMPGLGARLLSGATDWATESVDFSGELPFVALPQQYASFGMLLPGGILRWDPKAGFARKVRILIGAAGVRADFRGPNAPRPAASRLFVEASDAAESAVAIIRAVIRHSVALAAGVNTGSWKWWFRSLIGESARVPFWRRAIFEELDTIEAMPVYRLRDKYVTREELQAQLGRWVTVESKKSGDVRLATWGLNGVLLGLKAQRSSGEAVQVDLESAVAPSPETFKASGLFEDLYEDFD